MSYSEPLVSAAAGAASHTTAAPVQTALLQHARTVLETLALLVHSARDAAGNPRVGCGVELRNVRCGLEGMLA